MCKREGELPGSEQPLCRRAGAQLGEMAGVWPGGRDWGGQHEQRKVRTDQTQAGGGVGLHRSPLSCGDSKQVHRTDEEKKRHRGQACPQSGSRGRDRQLTAVLTTGFWVLWVDTLMFPSVCFISQHNKPRRCPALPLNSEIKARSLAHPPEPRLRATSWIPTFKHFWDVWETF